MKQVPTFKKYLTEEAVKQVYFTFGRMNPPTIGHGKLLDKLASLASNQGAGNYGNPQYKVFLSQNQDAKKNPLDYASKIKHVRKMFPKHGRNVILNKKIKTVFDAVTLLHDQGYTSVVMVVGSDRITEFKTLLEKYNGKPGRHGFYNFKSIRVVSAGDRDPDAEGVTGMSASKQRENATKNDFTTFSQGIPSDMTNKDAKKLFNDIRAGMGLKETKEFKNHISLKPVSDLREKYVSGDLFAEGERVRIKSTSAEGYVHRLGSNYVIVALDEGRISRQWIDNVEIINEAVSSKDSPTTLIAYIEKLKRNLETAKSKAEKKRIEKEIAKSKKQLFGEDKWYDDQPEWGTDEASSEAKAKTPGEPNRLENVKKVLRKKKFKRYK